MRRWPVWLAIAGLVAVSASAALPSSASTKPAKSCSTHHPYQGWTEVDIPQFPQWSTGVWSRAMTNYAIDQGTPGRVFITDGLTVMRSTDFGCTWKQVFQVAVPPVGVSYMTNYVEFLGAPGGNRVYIGTNLGDGGTGNLALYTSSDGGATFSQASGPTLPYADSRPTSLVTSPADPKRAYLVGNDPYYIERSDDAGASWNLMSGSVALGNNSVGYAVADPANANLLYAWSSGAGIFRSTDGGNTFTEISTTITPTGANAVAVVHAPGAPSLIVTTSNGLVGCNADCSLSGALPTPKYGTTTNPAPLAAVATSARGLTILENNNTSTTLPGSFITKYNASKGSWADISPPLGQTALMPVQIDAAATTTLWTATGTNLYYRAP
jgi:hypothetical protein